MANNGIEIPIVTKSDNRGIDQTNAGLSKLAQNAEKVDSAGRNARIGLRSIGEAANAIGGENIARLAGNAASAADVVGDLSGAFLTLNPTILGMSAIAMTAMAGITVLQSSLNSLDPAVAQLSQSLGDMTKRDDTVTTLSKIASVNYDVAESALRAAQGNAELAKQMRGLVDVAGKQRNWGDSLKGAFQVDQFGGVDPNRYATGMAAGFQMLTDPVKAASVSFNTLAGGAIAAAVGVSEFQASILRGASAQDAFYNSTDRVNQIIRGTAEEIETQRAAQDKLNKIVQASANYDRYKSAILQGAQEEKNYKKQIIELDERHAKTLKSLTVQSSELARKAGADRLRVETETTSNIEKANKDLAERLNDIESNRLTQLADENTRYQKQLRDMDRDTARNKENLARQSAAIEKTLRESISDIDRDVADRAGDIEEQRQSELEAVREKYGTVQLDQAKVYTEEELRTRQGYLEKQSQEEAAVINSKYNKELERAQRDAERRKAEAQERAVEARAEIEQRKIDQQEEMNWRRQLLEEQHAENIARADETAAKNSEQARAQTAEQIANIETQKQKQIETINATLAESQRAIATRRAEETAAHLEAEADARSAHLERMTELQDLRTEAEKLTDAMAGLADPAWQPWIDKAREYRAIITGEKVAYWVGEGTDAVLNSARSAGVNVTR